MTNFGACTIVAHNYLPQARILAESFKKFHPDSTFYIVIVDRPIEARLVRSDDFQVVPITDIDFGTEGFGHMAAIYDVTEFATSVKPFALKQLVGSHDCVFYIDPDIKLFAPLTPLVEKTVEIGWSLTPHSMKPIKRNEWQPTEQEIKAAGIYNLGYVGVTKKSVDLLEWWGERLRRDCIIDVENQLFTDQRWIDMAVGIFPVHIERITSYNVAYWNLDHRRLWKDGDTYMVDDDVLRFFHFSGYDPNKPHWISKYQIGRPRVLMSDNPVMAELFVDYGNQMLAIREEISDSGPYGWRDIIPGMSWTRGLRRQLRSELMAAELDGTDLPPTPYSKQGVNLFLDWLRGVRIGDQTQLPRFLSSIYWERGDLVHHFPEVRDGQHARLDEWIYKSGVVENPTIRSLFESTEVEESSELSIESRSKLPGGVDVFGYLNAELGVGEAGRLVCRALTAAGVPISTIANKETVSRQKYDFPVDDIGKYGTLFMSINADQLADSCAFLGQEFLKDRYVIGQWFWELEELPERYQRSFELVDEIWAPTLFIKEALEKKTPAHVKVVHMPLPLVTPKLGMAVSKDKFGICEGYSFLFTFDLMSVSKRKNALGLVDAYCSAFSENAGAVLVLKTINGERRLSELEEIRWKARNRKDIVIINQYLDVEESASLMDLCDCYISLHRSEGLGLTMAEAMLLGKPVIATAYSGNMDFMTNETSLLVPWKYTKVGKDAEGYPEDARWAEPDLIVASSIMRKLFQDREFGLALGERAKRDLQSRFSPEVTGERMKNRLESIWRKRNGK
jgi:glycosyltransferase involved in cell wall biosynthesis